MRLEDGASFVTGESHNRGNETGCSAVGPRHRAGTRVRDDLVGSVSDHKVQTTGSGSVLVHDAVRKVFTLGQLHGRRARSLSGGLSDALCVVEGVSGHGGVAEPEESDVGGVGVGEGESVGAGTGGDKVGFLDEGGVVG